MREEAAGNSKTVPSVMPDAEWLQVNIFLCVCVYVCMCVYIYICLSLYRMYVQFVSFSIGESGWGGSTSL